MSTECVLLSLTKKKKLKIAINRHRKDCFLIINGAQKGTMTEVEIPPFYFSLQYITSEQVPKGYDLKFLMSIKLFYETIPAKK